MARTPMYSRSPQRPAPAPDGRTPSAGAGALSSANAGAGLHQAGSAASRARPSLGPVNPDGAPPAAAPKPAGSAGPGPRWAGRFTGLGHHERWLWAGAALVLALLAAWPSWRAPPRPALTLAHIDKALRESIAREPLASATASAYQAVLPSVVRVVGDAGADDEANPKQAAKHPGAKAKPEPEGGPGARRQRAAPTPHALPDDDEAQASGASVGSGVVIVDSGLILTNLHVVAGAKRIRVTFADGSESAATVVNRQPHNDLAVLQARTLPDDLQAATLRAIQGLSPGDAVLAVGFPFGIGPSASAGVVSGLKREFRSPQGQQLLSNLIQFDAAANPGNSGGPLVTLDGHVVGIVTAIMNPEGHSTFIGIGFAVPIENAAAAVGLSPF